MFEGYLEVKRQSPRNKGEEGNKYDFQNFPNEEGG